MNPSIIPPGFLSTGVTASALLAGALGAFSGHPGYLCIALAIGAVVAINRGWTEAWKAARGVASKAAVALAVMFVLAHPARAGGPEVTSRAPMPADIPAAAQAAVQAVPPVASDEHAKAIAAAAVIAGFKAGFDTAKQGVEILPKSWMDTRAGQVLVGVICGGIIITTAAGAGVGAYLAPTLGK